MHHPVLPNGTIFVPHMMTGPSSLTPKCATICVSSGQSWRANHHTAKNKPVSPSKIKNITRSLESGLSYHTLFFNHGRIGFNAAISGEGKDLGGMCTPIASGSVLDRAAVQLQKVSMPSSLCMHKTIIHCCNRTLLG